jgi:hypothetical protein
MAAALLPLAIGVAGTAATKLLAPKPKIPVARPIPTRNAGVEALRGRDEIGRRRGYAASIRTGSQGAESALGGSKTTLGR